DLRRGGATRGQLIPVITNQGAVFVVGDPESVIRIECETDGSAERGAARPDRGPGQPGSRAGEGHRAEGQQERVVSAAAPQRGVAIGGDTDQPMELRAV